MKMIAKIVDRINEEVKDAKHYAEMYVEKKASGDSQWASRFKEMSNDELNHAMTLHELAVKEIETLKGVFVVPDQMQEKWDKAHKEYVDNVAWVKQMLTM